MFYNYIQLIHYFIFILVTNTIVHTIAIPVQQQAILEIPTTDYSVESIPYFDINTYKNLNKLEEFYGAIVDDVVITFIQEIIAVAPDTFLTIHELQNTGKGYCRTSLYDFMTILNHQLNEHILDSLVVSIKFLLENKCQCRNLIELNQCMSKQLSAIINPSSVSRNIIQRLYTQNDQTHSNSLIRIWRIITNRRWYLTLHHELNESKALESWLNSWLMNIEFNLKEEFDSKVSSIDFNVNLAEQ